jgi:hypothetical protein
MGVLGTFRESVTIINRTSKPLNVRYDGEDITLQPGENHGFPKVAVPFAKKQNAIKGTLPPSGNQNKMQFMVGVKGTKDVVTPISDKDLERYESRLELFDRDGEYSGEPMRKVKLLKRSGYSPDEAAVEVGTFDVNSAIE